MATELHQNSNKNYQQQYEQLCQEHGMFFYDFEKHFLELYIQRKADDEDLIQKIFNYLNESVEFRKGRDLVRDIKFGQKDFACFFFNYLFEKHIMGYDSTKTSTSGKPIISSRRLRIPELIARERSFYLNEQEILDFLHISGCDETVCKFFVSIIGVNELLALTLFATKFLNVPEAPFLVAVETERDLYPPKKPLKKLTYNFWSDSESSDKPFISFFATDKPPSAQFGGQIITEGAESKKWYFKTHQEGSKTESSTPVMYLSKSISSTHPVNIAELFVYKLLEKLGWGPNVTFIVNSFIKNDIFIITNDLENECGFKVAGYCKQRYISLDPTEQHDLKIKATAFDLLIRLLRLSDINEGNYGLTTDNSIKLIDFKVSKELGLFDPELFFKSFLKVNGYIYPNPPTENSPDLRLVPSILKQSSANEQQKISEGIAAFELINKDELGQAAQIAKTEVVDFLMSTDKISNLQTANIIGVNLNNDIEFLDGFIKILLKNYDIVMKCLKDGVKMP